MSGKHRSRSSRSKKIAMMGAATATATAMTMGVSPAPEADAAVSIDIPNPTHPSTPPPLASITLPVGVYTTGLPFRVLDLLAPNILQDSLPVGIDVVQFLSALDPKAFYNAVNATPFGADVSVENPLPAALPLAIRLLLQQAGLGALLAPTLDLNAIPIRVIGIVSYGFANYTTMDTYRKLAESTRTGEAPAPGYTPVEQSDPATPIVVPGLGSIQLPSIPNLTVLALVLIRDPGRPNGGVGARLAPLFAPFGIDTVTPDVEPVFPEGFNLLEPITVSTIGEDGCTNVVCIGTTWQGGAALLPIHLNLGVQYDPMSDFPATANPFSIANSLMAMVAPTYIIRGLDLPALAPQISEVTGDLVYGLLNTDDPEAVKDALNIYLTLPTSSLPLLEPARLAVDVINLFTGLGLGTPIADSIEPALKILVNIGYTDVVTPADIAANPTLGALYDPYQRTLSDDAMATPTPFLSPTLTPAEYLAVPGDVIQALVDGFTETFGNGYQISDPLRRNALADLLSLLGAQVPSLDLGSVIANLQNALPDLGASTFSTQEVTDFGDTTALRSVEVTTPEGSNSDNSRLAGNGDDQDGADIVVDDDGDDTTLSGDEADSEDGIHGTTPVKPRQTILSSIRDITHNVFRPFGHRATTVQDDDADNGNVSAEDDDTDTNAHDTDIKDDDGDGGGNTSPGASANAA